MNELYPKYLDTSNPKYLLLDNMFVASLLVSHYEKEMNGGFLDKLLSLGCDMQISLYYEKKSTKEVIKDITYQIGINGADIKGTYENQIDRNLMDKKYDDAKYIRKKLQIDDERLFYLHIYIVVYANSLAKLEMQIKRIENVMNEIGLKSVRAFYKQEETFLTALPIMKHYPLLKPITKRNVLTEGLSSTYPFVTNDICNPNGVFLGINTYHHSLIMIDRFDTTTYKNANMFILGTSGSGKSYITKLMIIRNRYQNISQYIVDPDREYVSLCKKLKGTMIDFKKITINIMDIRESTKEDSGSYLENKLGKLKTFFQMIFKDMTLEEEGMIEEKIIETYAQKGITFEDSSLYHSNHRFKEKEEMPILSDLYRLIKKDKKLKRFEMLLKPYVEGSMKCINQHTNADLLNKIVISDIYGVEEADLPVILYIVTEFYWDQIKRNRVEKKILYMDEAWKLINKSEETAQFVFKVFKTIRKYGGAGTVITQDTNDFFALHEGEFGKGIINNASIKCVFQLEENELKAIEGLIRLSENEKNKIAYLKRGECLLEVGREHVMMKVEASKMEHELITTDRQELEIIGGRKNEKRHYSDGKFNTES